MPTPIMILTGVAGSGKDTVASFLVKNHGAVAIAQADPMKRLAKLIFDFTDDQLWGPSESRNAVDQRYVVKPVPVEALSSARFLDLGRDPWAVADLHTWSDSGGRVHAWIDDVFPTSTEDEKHIWFHMLREWFNNLRAAYGSGLEPHGKHLTPRIVLQTLGTEWGRKIDPTMWNRYTMRIADQLLEGGVRYDRTAGGGLVSDPSNPGAPMVVITDGRFRNEILAVLKINGITVKISSPDEDSGSVEKAGITGHRSEAEQKTVPRHFFTYEFLNDKRNGLDECARHVKLLWDDITYNATKWR